MMQKKILIDGIMEYMENNPNEVYCAICGVVSTLKCSKCLSIYYCSAEHQLQDWSTHKLECKLMRSDANIQEASMMTSLDGMSAVLLI